MSRLKLVAFVATLLLLRALYRHFIPLAGKSRPSTCCCPFSVATLFHLRVLCRHSIPLAGSLSPRGGLLSVLCRQEAGCCPLFVAILLPLCRQDAGSCPLFVAILLPLVRSLSPLYSCCPGSLSPFYCFLCAEVVILLALCPLSVAILLPVARSLSPFYSLLPRFSVAILLLLVRRSRHSTRSLSALCRHSTASCAQKSPAYSLLSAEVASLSPYVRINFKYIPYCPQKSPYYSLSSV